MSGKPQGPILTRLDTFLRPKLIRYMVAQKKNRFDLGAIMNDGKIFLAKLSQGAIGEENAYLLGTLLVSKFHQLAMSRQQIAAAARRNFYLYIDEFHNFVTPSMAAILSGARKYRLRPHPRPSGTPAAREPGRGRGERRDRESLHPHLLSPGRLRCQETRGWVLAFFEAKDLQNLQVGEAICRVERAEFDFNLKTHRLPPVEAEAAEQCRAQIIALSRERYATPREDVEAALTPAEPAPVEVPSNSSPHPRASVPSNERLPHHPRECEQPAPPPPSAARTKAASVPPSEGRGGPQHKYLQELVQALGIGQGIQDND